MVPAVFITHDRDFALTVFCLEAYARHWPSCPIKFLVPVSDPALAERIDRCRLAEAVRTDDLRIVPTFKALKARAGDSPWVFWCSSDRYPYTSDPDGLGALSLDTVPPEVQAVRLTRWRDEDYLDGTKTEIGGVPFERGQIKHYGIWHHQFIRSEVLDWFLEGSDDETLDEFHRRISVNAKDNLGKFLLPETNLMKYEEPMIDGSLTLNYALRQLRRGKEVSANTTAATTGFSSPVIEHTGNFWRKRGLTAEEVLLAEPPSVPVHVNSFGGVGSKMLVRWLLPEDKWSLAHSHRRLPPLAYGEGEKVIYVFGDPRNAVLSVFQRREVRTGQHGFWGESSDNPAHDFALRHAVNIEADPYPMKQDWDLQRYVENGTDIFRLEEHFDNWIFGDLDYPVLFVRYEALERTTSEIASYLGMTLAPPIIKPRLSDWKRFPLLDDLYGSFSRRLERLPDLFVH